MTTPSDDELAAMPEGPQLIKAEPRYTCTGCKHLKTKYWRFMGDDDESDSGTDADCALIGKGISGYWSSGSDAPKWCPITPRAERPVSVAEAARVPTVDELASLMFAEWKRVDPRSKVAMFPASYIATFADMARAVHRALAGDPT